MSTLYWPFSLSKVTEWPGQRPGSYHVGTDFGVAQGTTLRATIDGTISRWTDQYGAYIIDIRADDGLLVRNGHMSRIDVSNGQRVTAGQPIGLTGGKPGTPGAGWSTGAHLHWELRRGTTWIDPRNLNPQPSHFDSQPQPIQKRDEFMKIVQTTKGDVYLATEDGFAHLGTGHHVDLFKRLIKADPDKFETYYPEEITKMNDVLRGLARSNNVSTPGEVVAVVDVDKIAKAVNDDAARRLQG